jgi:hypothetical protein
VAQRFEPWGSQLSGKGAQTMKTAWVTAAMATAGAAAPPPLRPLVEVEEEVYSYTPANNGAGPLWTHGNTCIVRLGDEVLASGIETLPDYKPLNNVRWTLFKRQADGWQLQARGDGTHEREPCPLVVFPDGHALLSINPNTCKPEEYDGTATPQVLDFALAAPTRALRTLEPAWDREIKFHAHTYRSFAADRLRREFLLIYNTAYDRAYWTFADAQGQWVKQGALEFPFGAEYDEPQPIRVCYPVVALKDRAVYFCGVSDIIEPYKAWRTFKEELTKQKWDYDFRRLFFTWCDDITAAGHFQRWVEIASRDQTCGWIFPCDLHVGADGSVHILWTEKALDERLRATFFPEAKQSIALNHAVVRQGEVVHRGTIQEWKEGGTHEERPGSGRFHGLPDGRLLVFYYVSGKDAEGKAVSENRLVEILADGSIAAPVKVSLQKPFSSFFTATPRAGNAPSVLIDVFGDVDKTMRYARVRLDTAPVAP